MYPKALYQIARERQAEMRSEAEMDRKTRRAKTENPIATRWKLSFVTALAIVIIFLVEILG